MGDSLLCVSSTGRAEQLPSSLCAHGLALPCPTPRAVLEALGLSADGFVACALVEQRARGWLREFVALL